MIWTVSPFNREKIADQQEIARAKREILFFSIGA
jgi:hypothetical protein